VKKRLTDLCLLLFGFLSPLAGSWCATQMVAGRAGYGAHLGEPWLALAGYPVYHPWTFFFWDLSHSTRASAEFCAQGWYLIWTFLAAGVVCLVLAGLDGVTWSGLKPRLLALFCLIPGAGCAVTGCWAAAQVTAKLMSYGAGLGHPWFFWYGYPVYRPHAFLLWYGYNHKYHPRLFGSAAVLAWAGLAIGCYLSLRLWMRLRKPAGKATSHGTAHWAGESDLERARLTDNNGVVLGRSTSGRLLSHEREEHVLLQAPPRTGKGLGVIIPTLFTWPHSVVISDIKGENWGITAGFRKKGLNNVVLRFDPTAEAGGARFNPLEEIRVGTLREVADTQNIADILVNPYGRGIETHWDKTGYDLLVGTILHILYTPEIKEKSLATLAVLLSDPERSFDDTLQAMLTAAHDPELRFGWKTASGMPTKTHPVVASAARAMLDRADGERSGVKSTALTTLSLYRDPLIARNTCRSDFRITDLMNHEKPVSLYMVIPTSEICRTSPLYRIIMNMLGRKLTESMEFENGRQVIRYRHRLLLLMDEFQALGQLDFFEAALAFIAGYGIKALLVVQNLEAIKKCYGPNNSIFSNCSVRVVFTPNDIDAAEFISRSLGEKTEVVTNTSYSGKRGNFWSGNATQSTQEVGRRLMTPGEISVLPDGEEIIFVAGYPPIKAKKIRYFEDKTFRARAMAAPAVSDVCGPCALDALRAAASPGGAARGAGAPAAEAAPVPRLSQREPEAAAPALPAVPAGKAPEVKTGPQEPPEWAGRLIEENKKGKPQEHRDDGTGGVIV